MSMDSEADGKRYGALDEAEPQATPRAPDDLLEAVAMSLAAPDGCCQIRDDDGRCCMTDRAREVLDTFAERTGLGVETLGRLAGDTDAVAPPQLIAGHPFEHWLDRALADLRALLLAKNKAYGNSALDPVRVFSSADPAQQIRVRLDDKISRMVRGHQFADENAAVNLMGYGVLLLIADLIAKEQAA